MKPQIIEVQTGRMRPRHGRFHRAFADLCRDLGVDSSFEPVTKLKRIKMNIATRRSGVRAINLNESNQCAIIHQALNAGTTLYISEFDMPLAVHGYNVQRHYKSALTARELMERDHLRSIMVFSHWSKQSFDLHFGEKVSAKCRVVYPLAYEEAVCGNLARRKYDFTFISTNFRIKCGPELVRAFSAVKSADHADIRLCVVTNLERARELLGDLASYKGVDWLEANQTEKQVAALLAETNCLVHPSLSDSFGVVVLEALAAGCALLTTDIASFPEMVINDENGFCFSPPTSSVVGGTFITEYGTVAYHEAYLNTLSLHTVEAMLKEKMSFMINNPSRVESMMKKSSSLYSERFSLAAWRQSVQGTLYFAFPELFRR